MINNKDKILELIDIIKTIIISEQGIENLERVVNDAMSNYVLDETILPFKIPDFRGKFVEHEPCCFWKARKRIRGNDEKITYDVFVKCIEENFIEDHRLSNDRSMLNFLFCPYCSRKIVVAVYD